MSSYDPVPVDGIITQEQFKASMKLVRLQIAVPISVLASISANIVCALAIKPGLRKLRLIHLVMNADKKLESMRSTPRCSVQTQQ